MTEHCEPYRTNEVQQLIDLRIKIIRLEAKLERALADIAQLRGQLERAKAIQEALERQADEV